MKLLMCRHVFAMPTRPASPAGPGTGDDFQPRRPLPGLVYNGVLVSYHGGLYLLLPIKFRAKWQGILDNVG